MGFFDSVGKALSPAYAFSKMGNKSKNPADAAAPYLNQIAPMAEKNLGPWQQQGQEAQQGNQEQYNQMAYHPEDFLNRLQQSYTPSAGYALKEENALKASRGAAAAGGRTATTENQAAQAKLIKDLMGEDMSDYVAQILGIQGTGLQGNENIANRGYGAAGDLTNVLGSTLGNQAQLAFKGQENKNATKQGLMKLFAQLAGAGVGAALGGPTGAAIGANAGGGFGSQVPSNDKQFGSGIPWGGNR